jgi:hypothetical protein
MVEKGLVEVGSWKYWRDNIKESGTFMDEAREILVKAI